MKIYFLFLSFAIMLTLGFCALYSIKLDAEIRFWKPLAKKKIQYANILSEQNKPKVVFAGGSSCTFSIRPDVLNAYEINSVNMGMHAGMGVLFNVAFASSVLQKGDFLVLALEPGILTSEFDQPTFLGACLAMAMKMPDLAVGGALMGRKLSIRQRLLAVRPGGRRVVTMLSKLALQRPMYRYTLDETSEDGWCFTSYDDERAIATGAYRKKDLSDSGSIFLSAIATEVRSKGASVYFLSPWVYTESEVVEGNRKITRCLLEQVDEIIPVLYDGYDGSCSNQVWYADTGMHLTPAGSIARTEAIATVLLPMLTSAIDQLKNVDENYSGPEKGSEKGPVRSL